MFIKSSYLTFIVLLGIVNPGYSYDLNTGPAFNLGCFKILNKDVLSKRTNVLSSGSCTSQCKHQKYLYAAMGQKQCFCLKSILSLLPSDCDNSTYTLERTISDLTQCNISSTVLSPMENLSLFCLINNSVSEASLRQAMLADKLHEPSFRIDGKIVNSSIVIYSNITVEYIMKSYFTVGRHTLKVKLQKKHKDYTFYQLKNPVLNFSFVVTGPNNKRTKDLHNGSIAVAFNNSMKFLVNSTDGRLKFKSMQIFCECLKHSIKYNYDQLDNVILPEPGLYSLLIRSENETDFNTLSLYKFLIVQVEINAIKLRNTATLRGVKMMYVLNTCGLDRLATDVSYIFEIEGHRYNTTEPTFNYTITVKNHPFVILKTTAYNFISSKSENNKIKIEDVILDYQVFFSPRSPALADEKIDVSSNLTTSNLGPDMNWILYNDLEDKKIKETKGSKDYGVFLNGNPNSCYRFELQAISILQKKSAKKTLCLLNRIDSFSIKFDSVNCTQVTFMIDLDPMAYNTSAFDDSYNPTVEWDFGDGTFTTSRKLRTVHHYAECRKGSVYTVSANVSNILSYKISTKEVYMGYGSCSMQIFSPWMKKKAKFSMMQTIYFGTYVNISCLSNDVLPEFQWEIRNKSTGELVLKSLRRSFYVQAREIGVGEFTYTFNVTVAIQSQVETGSLKIYRIGVQAALKQRGVISLDRNNSNRFEIDGSQSYDLDNPNGTKNIKFNWSCSVLKNPHLKCFKDPNYLGNVNSSVLSFRIIDLQIYNEERIDSFVFNLLVKSQDEKYNSTDKVQLDIMNIGIGPEVECLSCHLHNQSAHKFLLLRINCPLCGDHFTFKWRFKRSSRSSMVHDESCIKGTHHSKFNLMENLRDQEDPDEICYIRSIYESRTTCTSQVNSDLRCTKPAGVKPSYSIPIPSTSHLIMHGLFYEPYFTATPSNEIYQTANVDNIHTIQPSGNTFTMYQSTEVNVKNFLAGVHILGDYHTGEKPNIIWHKLFVDNDNLYGGSKQWDKMLIRPFLLKPGSQYKVTVEVKKNDHGLGKNTNFEFATYDDIRIGTCTISSELNGIELETIFTVTCKDWESDHPLYYSLEVMNKDNIFELVSVSKNRVFSFVLRRRRTDERIQIVIENTIGQSRRMCEMMLQLKANTLFDSSRNIVKMTSLDEYFKGKTKYTEKEFKIHVLSELIGKLNEINLAVSIEERKNAREYLCQQVRNHTDDVPLRIIANAMKLLTHASDELSPPCMNWILNKTGFLLQNINDACFLDPNTNQNYRGNHVTMIDDVIRLLGDQIDYYLGEEEEERENLKLVMARLMEFSIAIKSYQFINDRNYKNITINTYQKVFHQNGSCHIQLDDAVSIFIDSVLCYQKCLNISVIKYNNMKQPLLDGHNTLMDLSLSECFHEKSAPMQFDLLLDFQIPLKNIGKDQLLKLQEKNKYNVCSSEAIFWIIDFKELPSTDYNVEIKWKRNNETLQTITYPQNCTNHSCTYLQPSNKDTSNTPICYTLSLELHKSLLAYTFRRSIPGVKYSIVAANALCSSWNAFDSYSNQSICTTSTANSSHVTCKCERPAMVAANFKRISLRNTKESTALSRKCFIFDCYLVPVILAVFVIIFFSLFICLGFRNRKKGKRKGLYVLPDSHPFDMYKYDVIIETGHSPGAGTTSRVCFVLHGANGSSEKTELTCDGYDMFCRSAIDLIPFSAPQFLGDLKHITIWHNNEGNSPDWFIKRVTVKDKSTGLIYFFPFYSWLSLSKGIKKTNTDLIPTSIPYSYDTITFFEKILDFHAVLSVLFAVPARSGFSRNERLALILVNFLLYFMTSAYFCFELFPEEQFHRRHFQSIYLLKENVIINMLYLHLVLFLYNFIITFCLRNSVAKRNSLLIQRKSNKVDCYESAPGDICGNENGSHFGTDVGDYFVKGKVMYDEWSLSSMTSQKVKHSSDIVLSLDLPFWFRYVGYTLMTFTGLFSIVYLILKTNNMKTIVDISIWLHLIVVTAAMDLVLFSSIIALLCSVLVLCFPGLSFTYDYLFSFMACMQKHYIPYQHHEEMVLKRGKPFKNSFHNPISCFKKSQNPDNETEDIGFRMNMAKKKKTRFIKYAEPMSKKEREKLAISELKRKYSYKNLKEILTCVIFFVISFTIVSEKSLYSEKLLQSLVKADLNFKMFISAPDFWKWTNERLYPTLTNKNWPEPSTSNFDIIKKYLMKDEKKLDNDGFGRSLLNAIESVQSIRSSNDHSMPIHNTYKKIGLIMTNKKYNDSFQKTINIDISDDQMKFRAEFDSDFNITAEDDLNLSSNYVLDSDPKIFTPDSNIIENEDYDGLCDQPIVDENQKKKRKTDDDDDDDYDDDYDDDNDDYDDDKEDGRNDNDQKGSDYWTYSTPTPYPILETKHDNRRKRRVYCQIKVKAMQRYWKGKLGRVFNIISKSFVHHFINGSSINNSDPSNNRTVFMNNIDSLENITRIDISYTLKGIYPSKRTMYCTVQVSFQKHVTGLLIPTSKIHTYQFTTVSHFNTGLLLLVAFNFFFLYEMFKTFLQKGITYFGSFWHILNFLLVLTSFLLIVCSLLQTNIFNYYLSDESDTSRPIEGRLTHAIICRDLRFFLEGLFLVLTCFRSFWFFKFHIKTHYLMNVAIKSLKSFCIYLSLLIGFVAWFTSYMSNVLFMADLKYNVSYFQSFITILFSEPNSTIQVQNKNTFSFRFCVLISFIIYILSKLGFIFFLETLREKYLPKRKVTFFFSLFKKYWSSFKHGLHAIKTYRNASERTTCRGIYGIKKDDDVKSEFKTYLLDEIDFQLDQASYVLENINNNERFVHQDVVTAGLSRFVSDELLRDDIIKMMLYDDYDYDDIDNQDEESITNTNFDNSPRGFDSMVNNHGFSTFNHHTTSFAHLPLIHNESTDLVESQMSQKSGEGNALPQEYYQNTDVESHFPNLQNENTCADSPQPQIRCDDADVESSSPKTDKNLGMVWSKTNAASEQGDVIHNSPSLSQSELHKIPKEEEILISSAKKRKKITISNQNTNLDLTVTSLTDPLHISDLSQNSAFEREILKMSHIESEKEMLQRKIMFSQDNHAFEDERNDEKTIHSSSRQYQVSSPRASDYQQYGFHKENPSSSSGSGSSTRQDSGLPSRTSSASNSSSLLSERNSAGDIEQQNRFGDFMNIPTKIRNEPFSRPNFNNFQYESEQNQKRIEDILKSKKSLTEKEVEIRLQDVWRRENEDLVEESKQSAAYMKNLRKDIYSYDLSGPNNSIKKQYAIPSTRSHTERTKKMKKAKSRKHNKSIHEQKKVEFYHTSDSSSSLNNEQELFTRPTFNFQTNSLKNENENNEMALRKKKKKLSEDEAAKILNYMHLNDTTSSSIGQEKLFTRPYFNFQTDIMKNENENIELALNCKKKRISDEEAAEMLNYSRQRAAKFSSLENLKPVTSETQECGEKVRTVRRTKRSTKSSRVKKPNAETEFGVHMRNESIV